MGRLHEKLLLYVGIVCASASLGLMPNVAYAGIPIANNCVGGGTAPNGCTCSGDCKLVLVSIACTGRVITIPILGPKCTCACV